jgi:TonB family protein
VSENFWNTRQEIKKFVFDKSEIKLKGISLALSIFFHIGFLFFLIKISPPIKIYLYQEVAEVRIVSPEKIYIPRMDRFHETSLTSEISPQASLGEPSSPSGRESLPERERRDSQVYMPNLSISRNMENFRKYQPFSEGITPFGLIASSGKQSDFTLGIRGKELKPPDTAEDAPKGQLNLSGYSNDLSSIQFNRITYRKGIPGTRASRLGQGVLDATEKYDLSPWVKEVVDKIRNNWTVTPIKESLAIGEVKIFLSVSKDGELLRLEILNSSKLVLFDESALEAVESSLPFPPLPVEFPYEKLEALLVFQFNE